MEEIIYKLLTLIKENQELNIINGKPYEITYGMLELENKEALGRLILHVEKLELIKSEYRKSSNIPAVIFWECTELTPSGYKYLEDNSTISKTYKNIKKLIDLIP